MHASSSESARPTMEGRWQQGFSDAWTTLHASPWLAPTPKELGVRVFDAIHQIFLGHHKLRPEQRWGQMFRGFLLVHTDS